VGIVGNALGNAGVNIAGMQVARTNAGGDALMALTVDTAVSESVVAELKKETGAKFVQSVNLVG
jgi:D-3-phosphoglycerate dehydrogenase